MTGGEAEAGTFGLVRVGHSEEVAVESWVSRAKHLNSLG